MKLRPVQVPNEWGSDAGDLPYALRAQDSSRRRGDPPPSPPPLLLEEIAGLAAHVPGHNEEYRWYWVAHTPGRPEGPWALVDAWCDYTGWGCRDGCTVTYHPTAEAAATEADEVDKGYGWRDDRPVRSTLLAQLAETAPWGVVTVRAEEATDGVG